MNEINSRLAQYVSQLQAIQHDLENIKKTSNPHEKFGEEIVSKGIGALAEELFESATAGKIGQKRG